LQTEFGTLVAKRPSTYYVVDSLEKRCELASENEKRVSPGRARLIGLLWVNIPVAVIMFGGWGLPLLAAVHLRTTPIGAWGAGTVVAAWVLLPFIGAWTWWSVNVPRWRIWALKHCDDWAAVEQGAISDGLIWDETTLKGRMFARTQFWSTRQRECEAELRRVRGIPPRGITPNA
jgi:hypothetical protein